MITIEELNQVFELWVDKTQSPYFTSDEKDSFFNTAILNYVNSFFNVRNGHLAEATTTDLSKIHTLVKEVQVSSNEDGVVSFSDINSELDGSLMYILNVSRNPIDEECKGDFYDAHWMRHNSRYRAKRNDFLKGEEDYPNYYYFDDHILMDPKGETEVRVTACKYPVKVTLDDTNDLGVVGASHVDCDLPEVVKNEILYIALSEAGISMRDFDLSQISDIAKQRNE